MLQKAHLSSELNINDLPKEGLQVKVTYIIPNGKVSARILHDEDSKSLIRHPYENILQNILLKYSIEHPIEF